MSRTHRNPDPETSVIPNADVRGQGLAMQYRLVFFNSRGAEIGSLPFETLDGAIRFTSANPRIKATRSGIRALLPGLPERPVRWRTATIYEIGDAGELVELMTRYS